jgi:predicted transcriptional regulator
MQELQEIIEMEKPSVILPFTELQLKLLACLDYNGPLTRKELVRKLERPRTTIFDNLTKLQEQGLVKKYSRNNGKRGRPYVYWKIKMNLNGGL